MFPENYFIYIQLILFYFITPGPPRVLIVSYTISHGLKKSVWTAFGDISANFVQAALVTFVIGSVLIDNPSIFKYVKWAAILYLLYLAYEIFSQKIQKVDIGYVLVSGQTAIAGKGKDLLKNPDVGRLFLGG